MFYFFFSIGIYKKLIIYGEHFNLQHRTIVKLNKRKCWLNTHFWCPSIWRIFILFSFSSFLTSKGVRAHISNFFSNSFLMPSNFKGGILIWAIGVILDLWKNSIEGVTSSLWLDCQNTFHRNLQNLENLIFSCRIDWRTKKIWWRKFKNLKYICAPLLVVIEECVKNQLNLYLLIHFLRLVIQAPGQANFNRFHHRMYSSNEFFSNWNVSTDSSTYGSILSHNGEDKESAKIIIFYIYNRTNCANKIEQCKTDKLDNFHFSRIV